MLDHVFVEAYGERQSLPSVAQISLKTANLIVVNPFDAAVRGRRRPARARRRARGAAPRHARARLTTPLAPRTAPRPACIAQLADTIGDAIRDADLNLNPQVEGSLVRVPIPKSSKETKEATVKLISKIAEAGKNRVRRVRQAAMEKLKKTEGGWWGRCRTPPRRALSAARTQRGHAELAPRCARAHPLTPPTHTRGCCRREHRRHVSRHQGRQCAGGQRH